MEADKAEILEQKLKKLFGSDISYRERKAISRTIDLFKKKPYFESFISAVKNDSSIRRAIGHKKNNFMDLLNAHGKKVEAISIGSGEDDRSKSEKFNFKDCIEESEEEDVVDFRRRRQRRRRRRQRSTSMDSPEKRGGYEKRYKRKSMGAPIRNKLFSRNPAFKFMKNENSSFMEKAFILYSGMQAESNAKQQNKEKPGQVAEKPGKKSEGRASVKVTPYKGAIPPPPPSNLRKKNPLKKDKLARFLNRKDCIVVKNIPNYYNIVNYLIGYFKRFGEIVNISTFLDIKSSVVQYKAEIGAEKALTSPTIPFNLPQIELYCNGKKKVNPKSRDKSPKSASSNAPHHQQSKRSKPSYRRSNNFVPRKASYKESLEEKKRKWKLLQEGKTLIGQRLTTLIQLFLELKRTKKTQEEKNQVQKMILETNAKMVRVNECKDLSVLKSEFSENERQPLNITLIINSDKKLEYSYLSNLLSTYGKLQKLVIDESSLNAKIKFFSIGSAFRAYHDFLKEKHTGLRFEDEVLHSIVTTGKSPPKKKEKEVEEGEMEAEEQHKKQGAASSSGQEPLQVNQDETKPREEADKEAESNLEVSEPQEGAMQEEMSKENAVRARDNQNNSNRKEA